MSTAVDRSFVRRALFNVLSVHENGIEIIMNAWRLSHVKAFCIWDSDNQFLVCSPKSMENAPEWHDERAVQLRAPLLIEGQVVGQIGVLGLQSAYEQTRLEASAALISHLIAKQLEAEDVIAERIAQARLKAELDVTASIQLQLLPRNIPSVVGLDMYARCRPAAQVGGDFYTFTKHSSGHLVMTIGDVSGKGLPAALLMMMTRTVLRGVTRSIPLLHPKAVLHRINEDLYDDFTDVGMFVTVCIGCYDPVMKQFLYTNAGHSPVIYCPAGGSARILQADGPAIGVLPTIQSENVIFTFSAGDVLVLATDGLSEAHNPDGELYGYQRLCAEVEELRYCSAKEIAERLFESVTHFASECSQYDDQTLIVMKGV